MLYLRKFLFASALIGSLSVHALRLPAIIGDNMMLQQQSDARLWGWASPDSDVKVITDWNKKSYTIKADYTGKWTLNVATPEASFVPTSFSVHGDGTTITVDNVLIGEVWFASGQSNMAMTMAGGYASPVDGANDDIALAGRYKNAIRMVTVPMELSAVPQDSVSGDWKIACPENVVAFSAVGYYFAMKLSDILGVPVGIVCCAYGGAPVEGWMPAEILRDYPSVDLSLAAKDGVVPNNQPMAMYNAMLYPIAGYTVKGFLWNQGETNALTQTQAIYPEYLNKMVAHWRKLWGDNSLPFYTVEIPPFVYDGTDKTMGALLREAQQKAVSIIPNSGIISSIDLYSPGLFNQIHPSIKKPIGNRLAYMAAGDTYGVKGVRYLSPMFSRMELVENDSVAHLYFNNAHDGFFPYQGISGFEVAGSDKVFHKAEAQQSESLGALIVSSSEVAKIEAVRYAFKNWPSEANVYGVSGLPLLPFRTDNW